MPPPPPHPCYPKLSSDPVPPGKPRSRGRLRAAAHGVGKAWIDTPQLLPYTSESPSSQGVSRTRPPERRGYGRQARIQHKEERVSMPSSEYTEDLPTTSGEVATVEQDEYK
jgi:hypothetical protein